MPRLKLYFPGWNPAEIMSCSSQYIFSGGTVSTPATTSEVNLNHLVLLVSVKFPYCDITILPIVIDKHLKHLCSRIVSVCLADLYSPVFLRLTTPAWNGDFLFPLFYCHSALRMGILSSLIILASCISLPSALFWLSDCPRFSWWDPLKVVDSYILLICSHHFWELLCYLAKQDVPGSSFTFPAPA